VAGQSFPRPILFAVGGMLAMVTVVAGLSRLEGGVTEVPHSTPVLQRDLRFEDRADGGVTVRDAHDDHVVTVVTGQAGFLRATMRGLAQQRLRQDADRDVPFRLTEWADGRLTLEDPTTHRAVEMEAFGITNEEVFAALLPGKPAHE